MSDQHSVSALRGVASVVAVFLSGIAVNWLSDLFRPTPVIVISVALVAAILLYVADTNIPHGKIKALSPHTRDVVLFFLGAFLLGALVGVFWCLPIWPEQSWPVPLAGQIMDAFDYLSLPSIVGTPTVSSLESGAAATVALLGSFAALRKAPLKTVAWFTIMATSGMALAMALIKTHDLLFTFIGWAVASTLISVLAPILSKLSGAFLRFFDLPRSGTTSPDDSSSPSTTPSEEDVASHTAEETVVESPGPPPSNAQRQ